MGTSHEKHQEARIVLMHCWCTLDISITLGRTFHFNTIWADTDQGSSLRWSVSDRTHARDSGGSPDTCLSQVRVRSVVTAFMEAGKVWMGCLCLKHGLAHTVYTHIQYIYIVCVCVYVNIWTEYMNCWLHTTGFTFVFFRSTNITFQPVIFRKECTSQERRGCIFCLQGRHWPLHRLLHLM